MRTVLRQRDFRLLFAGLALSMVGDALMILVYGIWVKHLTGSSGAAGLVTLCMAVPYVAASLGGRFVDRFRRRPFLVVVNLASALALLPLYAVHTAGDVWIIYGVAALGGLSAVTNAAALNGLLKDLLADELLASANGVLQTVKEGLRLGGPLAGAALFAAFGGPAVATVDAVTFGFAALAVARMRLREEPPEPATGHWRAELTAGITHIRREPGLRRLLAACALAFLVVGINESVFFALLDRGLHRPPEFIGVLASAQGAGSVAGGLVAAAALRRTGDLATAALGLALFGVGDAVCVVPSLALVLAGKAIAGAGLAMLVVAYTTALQRRTPGPLAGRVSLAAETLTSGPQTVSIAAGAALVSVADYRLLIGVVAAGMLCAAAYLRAGARTVPVLT
jgi:Na+/melibiose symporter-like transporter